MFDYKLIGDNDYIFDVQGTISANRGLDDVKKMLEISNQHEISWKNLINIEKAVNKITHHIENKSKIMIIIDEDTDGYTSASIIYQYIKQQDKDIDIIWYVHSEKTHGIKGIEVPNDINLLIIPDSSSDEIEEHKRIFEQNTDIVVIDHHEIDDIRQNPYATIVNPQLGGNNNLQLSAAGVVYKVCKALDEYFWTDYADYYLDLVALGNIADSMSMKESETRYYVNRGLKEINNDFFRALLRHQEFSIKGKVNPITVNFYISPLTNAVTRIGDIKDREDLFKAFIGHKELVPYKPRGKEEVMVSFVEDMARRCYNIKNKQNRIKEKLTKEIEKVIVEKNLYENKLLFIKEVEEMEKGLSGLICNSLASKYKRPVMIVSTKTDGGTLSGSARGYDKGGFRTLKKTVSESGIFNYAKGHMSAFGFSINENKLHEVYLKMNDLLKDLNHSNFYEVDFHLPINSINESFLRQITELEDIWGKYIDEPYILLDNIKTKFINLELIGAKEDTIKFNQNNIEFVMFKQSFEVYETLKSSETFQLVGKAKVNNYKGKITYQIFIEDFNIID